MSRLMRHEEGMVVVMHERPCLGGEDYERVKAQLIEAGHSTTRVVIDCTAVETVSASFISAILVAFRTVAARPGDFVLCNLTPVAREVFEMLCLDAVLPIHETTEEALHAVGPAAEPISVKATM